MSELKREGVDTTQLLELRTAALIRTIELLDRLERMARRIGGFSSYEDQQALRESREHLAAMGMRIDPNPPQTWVDRVPRPMPHAIRGIDIPCEKCSALQGSTLDKGWYRCNACGYPGQ